MSKRAPLWRCLKCGHRFASRNLWHSCGNYQLAGHFRHRPRVVRQLFNRWRALARSCGPVTVYAQKTRIVFQARVRFAGAIVHNDWLEATLWLRRRVEHPCLHRVESLGRLGYAVHFRLTRLTDIDAELEVLMREAYAETAVVRAGTEEQEHKHMAITPYLYYEDVGRALRFLAKAFGFRRFGVQTRGPGGKINHAAMKLGDAVVMMGRPASGYRNPKRLGQATQSLYVNVNDVDKHFERARKAGAVILEEPTDTSYGHRRYGATDPEGHEWYFAQDIRRRKLRRKTV